MTSPAPERAGLGPFPAWCYLGLIPVISGFWVFFRWVRDGFLWLPHEVKRQGLCGAPLLRLCPPTPFPSSPSGSRLELRRSRQEHMVIGVGWSTSFLKVKINLLCFLPLGTVFPSVTPRVRSSRCKENAPPVLTVRVHRGTHRPNRGPCVRVCALP